MCIRISHKVSCPEKAIASVGRILCMQCESLMFPMKAKEVSVMRKAIVKKERGLPLNCAHIWFSCSLGESGECSVLFYAVADAPAATRQPRESSSGNDRNRAEWRRCGITRQNALRQLHRTSMALLRQ